MSETKYTLPLYADATDQEIFDRVATHLLRQNAVASRGGCCVYRDDQGRKCAVGALIPDEIYSPRMEGHNISNLWASVPGDCRERAAFAEKHWQLLRALQSVHDKVMGNAPGTCRPLFEEYLRRVAEHYELSTAVLDNWGKE